MEMHVQLFMNQRIFARFFLIFYISFSWEHTSLAPLSVHIPLKCNTEYFNSDDNKAACCAQREREQHYFPYVLLSLKPPASPPPPPTSTNKRNRSESAKTRRNTYMNISIIFISPFTLLFLVKQTFLLLLVFSRFVSCWQLGFLADIHT